MMEKVNKQIIIACGVLVKDVKVLLDLRNEPILPGSHMKWELPGGKIEWGETPEQALEREFEEETGIIVKATDLISVYSSIWEYPDKIQQVIVINYKCEYIGEGNKKLDAKIGDIRWFSWDETKTLDLLLGVRGTLDLVK